MNIQQIKALSKELKRSVKELLALSPKNDPFYCGSTTQKNWAEWLYKYWQEFGYSKEIHIRRIHYQLVSQAEAVIMPDGHPYENTEKCWKKLTEAAKSLRYLGLISCDQLVDRRSPPPLKFHRQDRDGEPFREEADSFIYSPYQDGLEVSDYPFPSLADLPTLEYQDLEYRPLYLLEIWCEKSTMNDILEPLCYQYGMNLVTGVGEISLTRCDELARRVREVGLPTRIFYLSDFDPAGQSMPLAVSRKLEWLFYGQNYDVQVLPVLLNNDQVGRYRLPKTPIKETEKRANHFEARFGQGATELDSLEAIYPGELERILLAALGPYLEANRLFRQAALNYNAARLEEIERLNNRIHAVYDGPWSHIQNDFERVEADFLGEIQALFTRYEERVEGLRERRSAIAQQIQADLENARNELNFSPLAAIEATEVHPYLLNTKLPYLDQLAIYKDFQGKQIEAEKSD